MADFDVTVGVTESETVEAICSDHRCYLGAVAFVLDFGQQLDGFNVVGVRGVGQCHKSKVTPVVENILSNSFQIADPYARNLTQYVFAFH